MGRDTTYSAESEWAKSSSDCKIGYCMKELVDELIEIAENESAILAFDGVNYPQMMIRLQDSSLSKVVMYTPNVDDTVAVTSLEATEQAGFGNDSQEFMGACDAFSHCCQIYEFRPAKFLEHWKGIGK